MLRMEIQIKADAKEIADLITALEDRRSISEISDHIMGVIADGLEDRAGKIPTHG